MTRDRSTSSSLAEAVGGVVIAAAQVEQSLAVALTMMTVSPLTALVVANRRMTGSAMIEACREVLGRGWTASTQDVESGRAARLGLLVPEVGLRISALLGECGEALANRNRVVHAIWTSDNDDAHLAHSPLPLSRREPNMWSLAEIDAVREGLDDARERLMHELLNIDWGWAKASRPPYGADERVAARADDARGE